MMVAARTARASGVRSQTCLWRTTLSTKYLVEAGSTRPETRPTAIKKKPRMSKLRRGFINAQTSGRFFHAFLRFFSLSLDPGSLDAALALVSAVMIRGRHPLLLDAVQVDATTLKETERFSNSC